MTPAEISRYLWEKMGRHWHEPEVRVAGHLFMCKCGQILRGDYNPDLTNFFSPEGEALWKWAREQEWWKQFLDWLCDRKSNECNGGCQECMAAFIGPGFIRRLVEYLKEKEGSDGRRCEEGNR